MSTDRKQPGRPPGAEKPNSKRRSPEEQVDLVFSATGLRDDERGAFLRRRGLHDSELAQLEKEVRAAAEAGLRSKGRKRGLSPSEKELKQVRRELMRKEKALAETAALLVLRGKVDAFLLEGEEGDTDKRSGR